MATPRHWTYSAFDADEELYQGDIIARTPAVEAILSDYHRYFLDAKYTFFIVTTQSCDLVVRGGTCKADYIALAVVRELGRILPDLIERLASTGLPGIFDVAKRGYVES